MVKTSDLSYQYENGHKISFPDISLDAGQHMLIIGPSGIGKTTLLNLLSGLLPPYTGSVSIGETNLTTLKRSELDRFRSLNIGLVFQKYLFINSLNVDDNLRLRENHPKKSVDTTRRNEMLERLGFTGHLKKKPSELSQGQQQRLGIALALIHKPKLILADEPTANLDDANCTKVINLLKDEAAISNSNLMIITHDLRVMAHFENKLGL